MRFQLRIFRIQIEYLFVFIQTFICYHGEAQNGESSLVNVMRSRENIESVLSLPNGFLACGTNESFIRILNVEEGFMVRTLKSMTVSSISSVAILENGHLSSALRNGVLEIWNLNEYLLVKSIKLFDDEIRLIVCLKNQIIAVVTWFEIVIFNLQTEEILNRLSSFSSSFLINSLVVLKNNLLVSSSLISADISIWNITSGEIVQNLIDHKGSVSVVILLPNGYLASGSDDNMVKVWDPYNATLMRTLKSHESKILSLTVLKNGLMASLALNGQIKIWNPDTETELKSFNSKTTLTSLAVSSLGYLIGVNLGEIYVWNHEKFNKVEETQSVVTLGK
jgi:WD40 repeat protein